MTLGLSMVVKNEEKYINQCLGDIFDLFDKIVIIDTGSSDNTIKILEDKFKAVVIKQKSPVVDNYSITKARNTSLQENNCDWILVLDADEKISREHILKLKEYIVDTHKAYFLVWRNSRLGNQFDDYKLALFRNGLGVKFEGIVHPNPQQSLRSQNIEAKLLDEIIVHHSLDKLSLSRGCRKQRLSRCMQKNPLYWRYTWFLGYMYFFENDFDKAVPLLRDTCNSLSNTFPVECLNAHIVLIAINARKRNQDKCERIMKQALSFFKSVQGDFEVKANLNLMPWLKETDSYINKKQLEKVKAYEFAH